MRYKVDRQVLYGTMLDINLIIYPSKLRCSDNVANTQTERQDLAMVSRSRGSSWARKRLTRPMMMRASSAPIFILRNFLAQRRSATAATAKQPITLLVTMRFARRLNIVPGVCGHKYSGRRRETNLETMQDSWVHERWEDHGISNKSSQKRPQPHCESLRCKI